MFASLARKPASPVPTRPRRVSGMTLIEVLVAVLILSVGLLGLAGMQAQSLRSNQSAYLKTQASMLAYDMSDRMRQNRERALAGAYNNFSTSNYSTQAPNCASTAGCTAANQVLLDMAEWAAEINGSGGAALLPSAVGSITRDGASGIFTITVTWVETDWSNANGKATANQTYSINFSL